VLLATPGAAVPSALPLRLFNAPRPGGLWMARSVTAMASVAHPALRWKDPHAVDQLLGLVGDVWLVTAGLSSPAGEETNYVFVARYPSSAAASEAYSRCMEATARGEISVLLTEPVDKTLAGSWTPDVESVSHVLPSLRKSLEANQAGSRRNERSELQAASR
jgi:hypothetical protein